MYRVLINCTVYCVRDNYSVYVSRIKMLTLTDNENGNANIGINLNEEGDEGSVEETRTKRKNRLYKPHRTFDTKQEAIQAVEQEGA